MDLFMDLFVFVFNVVVLLFVSLASASSLTRCFIFSYVV